MKRALRAALILSAVSLLLGGFSYVCPSWTEESGLDFWNLPDLQAMLDEQEELTVQLNQESAALRNCIEQRCALAEEVIDEHISLDQALDEFLSLNESDPARAEVVQSFFPAPTLEESTFLQVVSFVRARLQDQPTRSSEVTSRLRRQFEATRKSRSPRVH